MSTSPSSFQGFERARPDRSKTMFPDLTRDDVFRLETRRLWLRWPRLADVQAIVRLAGEKAVAEMTARIPHPYDPEDAERFVFMARKSNADGKGLQLAITPKGRPNSLIGVGRDRSEPGQGHAPSRLLARHPFLGARPRDRSGAGADRCVLRLWRWQRDHGLRAGHQPGLPPGAREMRVRLSGLGPCRVAGAGRALSGGAFPARPPRLGEPEDLGHSGLVPDPVETEPRP